MENNMAEAKVMEQLHVERLSCDSLVLESKDKKSSIVIKSMSDGVGLWLQKGDVGVTLYSIPGQDAVLALYNIKENHEGHQLAFWVDDKGNPQIQLIKDSKFNFNVVEKLCD